MQRTTYANLTQRLMTSFIRRTNEREVKRFEQLNATFKLQERSRTMSTSVV